MRNTRRPLWRLIALLTALGLIAAACGDDDGAAEGSSATTFADGGVIGGGDDDDDEAEEVVATHGGRIVVGLEGESLSWAPGSSEWTAGGLSVAYAIYDPLISMTAEGAYEPYLAESFEPNDDLTEWTITLRDGVEFHDGSPLDAETLLWNFETLHMADTSNTRSALTSAGVTGMEVVDEMSVKYVLSATNAGFPDLLRGVIGMPVSREAYESMGADAFASAPVGTGPFVFQEWIRDGNLTVTRNPNYWFTNAAGDQLPYLDEIVFRPIPDEESRAISLEADDIQVIQTLRGSTAKQVLSLVDDSARDYRAVTFVGNLSGSAIFNTAVPPTDDVRVRRAFAMGSDGSQVAEVLGDDGLVPPSPGFFSADSPWYSQEAADAYPGTAGRNLEGAQALLEEYMNDPERSDGKPVGSKVTIEYSCLPDASLLEVAQLQQSLLTEVGFEVTLEQVDQATLIGNALGGADQSPPFVGDFSVNCWRSPALTGDPLTDFQGFFGDPATSATNFTNFTTPEILDAIDTLRSSSDFQERYDAVEQIGIIAGENVPIAFSSATPTLVGYRGDIRGIPSWTLPSGTEGTGIPGGVMRFHEAFMAPAE